MSKNAIKLSDHFTVGRLLKFVYPSIIMMVFTSIYGIVDGIFVSNFAGKTPFAAINLIFPVLMVMGAVGFMIGTGGTAIVAKTLGEKKPELANRYFSMLVYVTVVLGIVLGAVGIIFMPQMSALLGASGEMLGYCVLYGNINLIALPFFMLQNVFQSFFVTAEKPKLGLFVIVLAGVTNMVLDALFVGVLGWGLVGAAVATAMSQVVGGLVPVVYFARKNSSILKLGKTQFYGKVFLKTCTNGSSELMSNISSSIVTILYNYQLMRLAGENGLAAYGAIMYIGFIFVAIVIGYSIGCAPIVGYNYGADNRKELSGVFGRSVAILGVTGVLMTVSAELLAWPLCAIFVGYDAELLAMTVRGMQIHSIHFLICGFCIFGSGFFTALNNGLVSAIISFLRTLVFQCAAIIILPQIFMLDGVWLAIIVAEVSSFILTTAFIFANKNKYGYMGKFSKPPKEQKESIID
ncbi:MAG: MATE family efflux transporter [Clostridia bacterium]|nr:MATE family efflux transporter [Clostridia bacterium]